MKIELIEEAKTIISNPNSKFGYFAWPTVALLQNGVIAVGASGFRFEHVCPFGKAVISYSYDGGETYTNPAPVIDTPLDDRDAGICTFGEKGVIFTSFNNSADMQRQYNEDNKFVQAYIDTITKEDEEKYLGVTFRISRDCATTFGEIYRSPVTCPHGPTELRDGTILWVGTDFYDYESGIKVVKFNPENCETELVGQIVLDDDFCVLSEPHLLELPNGKLICQIRGERSDDSVFTVYQSVSEDGGKTWTVPEMLLDETGGSPPHMIQLRSGVIVSTYGRRKMPYGIMAMFSTDGGKTWEKDVRLYENLVSDDIGYPSTIELDDGTLLTVFYAKDGDDEAPCVIKQLKWRIL